MGGDFTDGDSNDRDKDFALQGERMMQVVLIGADAILEAMENPRGTL